jgi:hypothetical protein
VTSKNYPNTNSYETTFGIASLPSFFRKNINSFNNKRNSFLLTISNINAHIAGALGKKTFLLAPFSKGRIWYWHDGLKQSLWYPSIQIFTQNEAGDWSLPINEIKEKIVKEIAHE